MQSITQEADLRAIESEPQSGIFFYVDWSSYAVRGRQVLEEIELLLLPRGMPFWLADISDLDGPAAFMLDWLKRREPPGANLSLVALGNGSIAWLRSGQIVEFVLNGGYQEARVLAERTENIFSAEA